MMDGMGGSFMWLAWIFVVLIIGLIIWAVIFVVNKSQNNSLNISGGETPLEILKRRYAKGEITDEEFNEKKRNL
jgi:putative membrane protein